MGVEYENFIEMKDIALDFETEESGNISEELRAEREWELPYVPENEVMRYFINLSRKNFSVEIGMYPLGSCTMKYNPRLSERLAFDSRIQYIHPLLLELVADRVQGILRIFYELEERLKLITGMDAFTFQPAAGAHGELTGVFIIRKYHIINGQNERKLILVPDSAHGTNPATAAMAGCYVKEVKSDQDGCVDLKELEKILTDKSNEIAAFMLTNPNTLGIYDKNIEKICAMVHEAGGLMYYDGANLNAIMGRSRPGDMGFDVVHLNLHKTFGTPHGGGGPGSGPVGVKEFLREFLPVPVIVERTNGVLEFDWNLKYSVGKMIGWWGNFAVVVKALAWLLATGKEVKKVSEDAVLNANWLKKKVMEFLDVPYPHNTMHEFVASAKELKKDYGVTALDLAKGLLDNGIHAPTIYFPLIVSEALMIEPTETETLARLEEFVEVLKNLVEEAKRDPEKVKGYPYNTPVSRPDEVRAVKELDVKWEV